MEYFELGKWYSEFDENGNCMAAVYSDSFRDVLKDESTPGNANTERAWMNSIHPDDVARLDAHLADCLSNHPEGMDLDIEYRVMTKYGYRLFHDYGRCTRRSDGSVISCDGAIYDIRDA